MDIVNFFETVEGTWFSQRTTHFSLGHPSQTGDCSLHITRLTDSDPRVITLCNQFSADSQQLLFALGIEQTGSKTTYGASEPRPTPSTVFIGCKANGTQPGQFFSQTDQAPAIQGHYSFDHDVLTLITNNPELQSEERLWFMNPNLRMRTSLLKRIDGFQMASFCSEIRRLS